MIEPEPWIDGGANWRRHRPLPTSEVKIVVIHAGRPAVGRVLSIIRRQFPFMNIFLTCNPDTVPVYVSGCDPLLFIIIGIPPLKAVDRFFTSLRTRFSHARIICIADAFSASMEIGVRAAGVIFMGSVARFETVADHILATAMTTQWYPTTCQGWALRYAGKEHDMKYNLVFVDDNRQVLNALKRTFINTPYRLHLFDDPKQAIDAIPALKPAVVVADYRMPGMDGVSLLETIKDQAPDAVRFMLTGYADLKTSLAAINRGQIYRYLEKPWDEKELKAHIQDAIAFYELNRANSSADVAIERLGGARELSIAVCHELAQPLQVILGYADLLLETQCDDRERLTFISEIRSKATRMGATLRKLRNLYQYCTRPYGPCTMVDIEKATQP